MASQADIGSTSSSLETYETKPSLKNASILGLQTGLIGTVVSAFQNAFQAHNRGAAGVFTRTGGTIGTFAVAGASYSFTESVLANSRETDDAWNHVAGGCAAGFLSAVRTGSLPVAFASCAFGAATMGVWKSTSGLGGVGRDYESPEAIEERRARFFKHPQSKAEA